MGSLEHIIRHLGRFILLQCKGSSGCLLCQPLSPRKIHRLDIRCPFKKISMKHVIKINA